jgi:hypothetical protein
MDDDHYRCISGKTRIGAVDRHPEEQREIEEPRAIASGASVIEARAREHDAERKRGLPSPTAVASASCAEEASAATICPGLTRLRRIA